MERTSKPWTLAILDAAIVRGLADANAGLTMLASEVFDRLGDKYSALAAGQKKVDPGSSPE